MVSRNKISLERIGENMEFQKMKDLRIVPPEELPRTCGLSTMLEKQKELNESIYPIVLKNLRLSNLEELENYSIEEIISKHLSLIHIYS